MKTFVSKSLEETGEIARNWLNELEKVQTETPEAITVGLSGHLGAGKTAFVKEVAKKLGIQEDVTSPTFVIMKPYEITHSRWHRLIHIDAYRLERREELEALDFENLVSDPYNLVLIEWPENVGLAAKDLTTFLIFDIREGNHTISL